MVEKKALSSEVTATDSKKKRRVGFFDVDSGVEANECIQIYLVSNKEEVDSSDCFCIDPVDLNGFFGEDGKIYGYQGLKISVWFSIISFSAYANISFDSKSDGGKGITDIKSALQKIFAETIVESKDEFLKTFSSESDFVSSIISEGEVLSPKLSSVHLTSVLDNSSDVQVVRLKLEKVAAGLLYCRLVPLVLLLVDGSNPIEVTDSRWELYVLIQGQKEHRLLGFTAVYRFYHYPDQTRLRLGQILVLPPYQHKGYGCHILDVLNNVATSEDVYDLTVEEPLDYFQHVRTCLDVKRLLAFSPIQDALNSVASKLKEGKQSEKSVVFRITPPPSAVEEVRKTLKINKKQFLQCWEVLVYLQLDPEDKCIELLFTVLISSRVKADILGKGPSAVRKQLIEVPTDFDPSMSFVVLETKDAESCSHSATENQTNVDEQLKQLVDDRMSEIKLIAQKVHRASSNESVRSKALIAAM